MVQGKYVHVTFWEPQELVAEIKQGKLNQNSIHMLILVSRQLAILVTVINPAAGYHYLLPGLLLPSHPVSNYTA